MSVQLGGRRLAGAVGVVAAGFAGTQSAEAAAIRMNVSEDVPPTYSVNLGGDGTNEFNITQTIDGNLMGTPGVKIDSFAAGAGVIPGANGAANLAFGTLIDTTDTFTAPQFGSRLNHTDGSGHFNNATGYVGVEFQLNGNTHYGYVGYEGFQRTELPLGHIFALGWEDQPNTGILAGAGIPEPSSLALLAAGAAAIGLYRRRRSA
jgi:hypothetical protein